MRIVGVLLASLVLRIAVQAQEKVNELSWQDTRGKIQRLGGYKGKIVVLNFWATWCEGCRHEMPLLAKMQGKYADKGLARIIREDIASAQSLVRSGL
jgi:thiol-disulfide isomerase/thioredoxin